MFGGRESRRQHESLMRLLAPAPVVPRHLAETLLEPRGASIADGGWNGVGWVEDGPDRFPWAEVEDA